VQHISKYPKQTKFAIALYCGEDIQKYLTGLRSCVDCLLGFLTTNISEGPIGLLMPMLVIVSFSIVFN
jgi:hypothetical protein